MSDHLEEFLALASRAKRTRVATVAGGKLLEQQERTIKVIAREAFQDKVDIQEVGPVGSAGIDPPPRTIPAVKFNSESLDLHPKAVPAAGQPRHVMEAESAPEDSPRSPSPLRLGQFSSPLPLFSVGGGDAARTLSTLAQMSPPSDRRDARRSRHRPRIHGVGSLCEISDDSFTARRRE